MASTPDAQLEIRPVHPIRPDDDAHNDGNDSTFDEIDETSGYTASLLSEVYEHRYENGRRYHSYREGQYILPNDEEEQDRQDLLHHVRNLILRGALFRAPLPKEGPKRALDVGTGTGIWAIDFADTFPGAEVIGTDLSPIQPNWIPPNLQFYIDDAEVPWTFDPNRPFDFIHLRDLGGSIADWPQLLRQIYDHLQPGGWVELQEFEVTLHTDDDSLRLAPTLCEFIRKLHEASEMFKKPLNIAQMHRQGLIDAGFEEVTEEIHKVPTSSWPEDPLLKQVGRYNLCSSLMAVESYSLALFTRVLGWSNRETQVYLAACLEGSLGHLNIHDWFAQVKTSKSEMMARIYESLQSQDLNPFVTAQTRVLPAADAVVDDHAVPETVNKVNLQVFQYYFVDE